MTQTTDSPKIALITGGSRGIGKSIVQHIAGRGSDVIFTYVQNQTEAEALVKEVQALGRRAAHLQLDIGNTSQFASFAEQLKAVLKAWEVGQFDYLIHNAGTPGSGLIAEISEADFDQTINVHVKGPLFLTQTLLPLIADGGRIINISTALTRVTYPGQGVYALAKSGLEVMTRYLAAELGKRQITANVVAPGGIATDFGGGVMRSQEMQDFAATITALGRVGQPDDIGGVVASLLAPEMGWISGQRIEASGGQNL